MYTHSEYPQANIIYAQDIDANNHPRRHAETYLPGLNVKILDK